MPTELPLTGNDARWQRPNPRAGSKVTAVQPIAIGTASNVYSIVLTQQNQVVAVDSLNLIAFIHRNNFAVHGGNSGQLRYDLSIDGGNTFNNDIGLMNPLGTLPSRYPQMTILNASATTDPLNAKLVYSGITLASQFDGYVFGLTEVTTSGSPSTTENYQFQGMSNGLSGGLCQGAPGVFWMVDNQNSLTGLSDTIYVYRGAYNQGTADVDWERTDSIPMQSYTGFGGQSIFANANIAFAPDGQTGWIAWLGDPIGGPDSTLLPVFCKTTDCGNTWSAPNEINLNTIPWVKDSLQTLWVDQFGMPISNGRASCSYEFDLTVDADGNPHMLVVVGTGRDYNFLGSLAKFLGDVTTPDGGFTWDIDYLSPVLTFRTPYLGTSVNLTMDNNLQVARDEGGCNIFFAWVDSDTSIVAGNQNGVGFGVFDNQAPNLRIAAKNVATGYQTYPKLVTDLDGTWDGLALFPTMAPIVRATANGWQLPIVAAKITNNDPLSPASFHYFGNDAFIPNSGWCDPAMMTLAWDNFGYSGFVPPLCNPNPVAFCNQPLAIPCGPVGISAPNPTRLVLHDAFPNPATGLTQIGFDMPIATRLQLQLINGFGQEVVVLADGEWAAGTHIFSLDASQLAAGMYFCRLQTEDQVLSKRLIVTH